LPFSTVFATLECTHEGKICDSKLRIPFLVSYLAMIGERVDTGVNKLEKLVKIAIYTLSG